MFVLILFFFLQVFFNKKWAKPAFFSESKCRTNGKIMEFKLPKLEYTKIIQPALIFSTALDIQSIFFDLVQVLFSFPIMPILLLLKKKKPSWLFSETAM